MDCLELAGWCLPALDADLWFRGENNNNLGETRERVREEKPDRHYGRCRSDPRHGSY